MTVLRIWQKVIAEACPTPRSTKRFLNRLRFLAMRQRPRSARLSLAERIVASLRDKPRRPGSQEGSTLSEPMLVALSAIEGLQPGQLDFIVQYGTFPNIGKGTPSDNRANGLITKAIANHRAEMSKDPDESHLWVWPPTKEQIAWFRNDRTLVEIND